MDEHAVYGTKAAREMAIFDRLPPKMRDALREAPIEVPPQIAAELVRRHGVGMAVVELQRAVDRIRGVPSAS